MTDQPNDPTPAVDEMDDLELITSYLNGHLDADRAAEVQRRLEEDAAFRELAAPLLLVWSIPPRHERKPRPEGETDRAWEEFVRRTGFPNRPRLDAPPPGRNRWRMGLMILVALLGALGISIVGRQGAEVAPVPRAATAEFVTPASATSCSSGAGGGFILTRRASASFAVSVVDDTVIVHGVIIGRSQRGWRGHGGASQLVDQPPMPGASSDLGGGTMDTLWMMFDVAQDAAWVHGRRVSMRSGNLVFVDRIDGVGGELLVLGALPFVERLPVEGVRCGGDFAPVRDALREALLSDPRVKRFVER